MRLGNRQIGRGRSEENRLNEAQRIGNAESACERRHIGKYAIENGICMGFDRFGKEHFLRQEAIEQRNAGHGRTCNDRERSREWHIAKQTAQLAHVARARLVIDNTGRHEQRRLEGRVVHHVEDGGNRRKRTAKAKQSRDKAEMTDRRIGEQALEVLLEHCKIGAEQQRDDPGCSDDVEPLIRAGESRPETSQQEDAGLHQRCGMQIGRDGRRRRHRIRKPEMEGKLRALRQRAKQDQNQRRQIERMAADDVARRQDLVEIVAAGDMAEQDQPDQEAEPADPRDRQRHAGAIARCRGIVPIADQQEGKDAGQLPEYREQNDIARQHDAQHRPHEGKQEGEEARNRVLLRHVIAGIDDDEEADRGDDDRKQPGKAIHPETEIEPQLRQPLYAVADDATVHDGGIEACGDEECQECDGAGDPGRTAPRLRAQQAYGKKTSDKRQSQKC